ncbi:putative E3 ubiquitin-protein ligase TRIML1 [Macrotis lagotis]|uniref:putative E3 ubiquitin-protein ligase TRIML1 n=1 Tax=Macrotis lagotis TaxID=92651 RepID=UPI003D680ABF
MNSKTIFESFKVNLTCVLCLGYLTDPLIVKCGHTFCKECLLSCWKKTDTPISCPNCGEIIECGDFLYNRRLRNLIITGKKLRPLLLQSIRDLTTCDIHGKDVTYFCEEDHRPLCGRCISSTEHKEHKVLLLEKAVGQCTEKLQEKWDILNQKKQKFQTELEYDENREVQWELEGWNLKEMLQYEFKKIHQFFLEEEKLQLQRLDKEANLTVEEKEDSSSQEILNLPMNSEKQPVEMFKLEDQARRKSVESEFEKKHQLLSDKKQLQFQILDQEVKDNSTKFEESKTKMTEQIHNLQMVMSEIEKNFEKLPIEMLQDTKGILERNEDLLQNPVVASPRLTIYEIPGMTEMLQTFHRDLTLDPKTAHPNLLLSDDLKSVEYVSVPQNVPHNPERFDFVLRVLASQSFTSGKHYWEVEVGNKTEWEVGICKESIRRKGKVPDSFRNTRTLLAFTYGNKFHLCCSHHDIHVCQPLHKVGIFLDYERGHIAFYNAADRTLICSPPNDVFRGPLCPYFSPCSQNGSNSSGPLRICPRSKKYNAN